MKPKTLKQMKDEFDCTLMGDHYNEGYEYGKKEERERHKSLVFLAKEILRVDAPQEIMHTAEQALKSAGYLEGKDGN